MSALSRQTRPRRLRTGERFRRDFLVVAGGDARRESPRIGELIFATCRTGRLRAQNRVALRAVLRDLATFVGRRIVAAALINIAGRGEGR